MKLLISIANFFIYPVVKIYWRIFKPKTIGVKVFIKHGNKVLFVRNSYGTKSWTLPGGGVKRGESLEVAAKREVWEETGIKLDEVINKGSFFYDGEGKQNTIFVFLAEVNSDFVKIDNVEIQAASWEDIDSLTLSKSPIAKKCFELAGYEIESRT